MIHGVDLKAIYARLAAASPGPWTYGEGYEQSDQVGPYIANATNGIVMSEDTGLRPEDQAFITHAHDDIRALLDLIDGLTEDES